MPNRQEKIYFRELLLNLHRDRLLDLAELFLIMEMDMIKISYPFFSFNVNNKLKWIIGVKC